MEKLGYSWYFYIYHDIRILSDDCRGTFSTHDNGMISTVLMMILQLLQPNNSQIYIYKLLHRHSQFKSSVSKR